MEGILAKPLSFVGMRKTGLRKQLAQPSKGYKNPYVLGKDTNLRSLVLRIQTRSIRLVSFHSTYGFLYPSILSFKRDTKITACLKSIETFLKA